MRGKAFFNLAIPVKAGKKIKRYQNLISCPPCGKGNSR